MTLTALVNNALRRLGEQRINAITDSDPRATLAAELWPNTRDEVFRDHEWSIAIRRRELAELNDENLTPYAHRYRLPLDPVCLRVLNLIDSDGHDIPHEMGRYIIEGRALATDVSPCRIRFITAVEEVTEYDSLLTEAMALRLASKMASVLTQSQQIENSMLQQYVAVLTVAKGHDAHESWQGYRVNTSWDQVHTQHLRKQGWYE